MNKFELFLLDYDFSWYWSKLLPYLLFVLLGVVLMLFFIKKNSLKSRFLKLGMSFCLLLIPFLIYFVISPIYEGDFTNSSIEKKVTQESAELSENKLTVISIANCPYCYDAIDRLKKMKSRSTNLEIEFRVCSSDSNSMEWYKEKSKNDIAILLSENLIGLSEVAEGRYPTFVLREGDDLKIWSNDQFGVAALDEIEKMFK